MTLRRLRAAAVALGLAIGPGLAAPAGALAGTGKHRSGASTSRTTGGSGTVAAVAPGTQSNPLGSPITTPGATSAPATPTATVPAAPTSTSGSGISAGSAIGIALAAAAIIIGIGVAIMRDARRRTRHRHAPSASAERIPGSKRPPKARKLSPAERRRRKRGRAPRRR